MQDNYGVGGDTFATTGKAHFLGSSGFHIDLANVDLQVRGQDFSHLPYVFTQPGLLGNYRYIGVTHAEIFRAQSSYHLAQQNPAVNAGISIIRVRKVSADISQTRSTQ